MKRIVPARTSARLQGGLTGHATCKKFELVGLFMRNTKGTALAPTLRNIQLRGQPKWPFDRYMCSDDMNVADSPTGANHLNI